MVDTAAMQITSYIKVPARIPTSCGFAGKDMSLLVAVTATYGIPDAELENDGMAFIHRPGTKGRLPFLFNTENIGK